MTEDEKILLEGFSSKAMQEWENYDIGRRRFFKQSSLAAGALMAAQLIDTEAKSQPDKVPLPDVPPESLENAFTLSFKMNGANKTIALDSPSLLDTLRERLNMTGTKKGCDHGQCGACTVIADGKRVLSCLTLAASCESKSVTTIEGLAKGDILHPVQAAFIKHDGFSAAIARQARSAQRLHY